MLNIDAGMGFSITLIILSFSFMLARIVTSPSVYESQEESHEKQKEEKNLFFAYESKKTRIKLLTETLRYRKNEQNLFRESVNTYVNRKRVIGIEEELLGNEVIQISNSVMNLADKIINIQDGMSDLQRLITQDGLNKAIETQLISQIQIQIVKVISFFESCDTSKKELQVLLGGAGFLRFLSSDFLLTPLSEALDQEALLGLEDKKQFTSLIHSWLSLHATELSEYQKEVSAIKASLDSSSQYAGVMDLVEADLSTHTEAVAKISSR